MPEVFYSASQEYLDTSQFDRLGHPGKFSGMIVTEGNGQTDFTGSNYGYGAVMVSGSWSGTITLSEGGQITTAADVLTNGTIYELSVAKVSGGEDSVGGIYAFKRQQ